MFKRAIKANHWMAIGLDKWNELENMEIPIGLVRKMRKLRDLASDSEDEGDSNSDVTESLSQGDVEDLEHADEDSLADSIIEEAEAPEDSEDEERKESDSFTLCPICPGRKFLTKKDEEQHMNSAKHLKRLRSKDNGRAEVAPEPRVKKAKVVKIAKTVSNRKSRRAHLVDTSRC
jgi:hypothetical protein